MFLFYIEGSALEEIGFADICISRYRGQICQGAKSTTANDSGEIRRLDIDAILTQC